MSNPPPLTDWAQQKGSHHAAQYPFHEKLGHPQYWWPLQNQAIHPGWFVFCFGGRGEGTGVTPNMKHEAGISVKPAVSHKCCHMPTLLCKKYQMKSPLQVHTAEYCAFIQSWRTSLTVRMGWCSLIISWLAHLMSMQIVTSPSSLGATTSGETQLVGLFGTSSMIPQASNSSNFFSNFSLTPDGMDGLCNWFYRSIDIKFKLVKV